MAFERLLACEINDVESDETGECSNSGSHRDRKRIKLLEGMNNGLLPNNYVYARLLGSCFKMGQISD
ncbi:hypothetical protein ACO02O_07565 [Dirofilaria immitis]